MSRFGSALIERIRRNHLGGHGHHMTLDAKGYVYLIMDHLMRDLGSVSPWTLPGSAPSQD